MNCSPPGFSVHGIFQAKILEWVAISFSRASSRTPRDRTMSPALAGGFSATTPPRKSPVSRWQQVLNAGLPGRTGGGGPQAAQPGLTAMLRWSSASDQHYLDCFKHSQSSVPGQSVPISLGPVFSRGSSVAITQLTSSTWWEFQYLWDSSQDTAQKIICSPWEGTKGPWLCLMTKLLLLGLIWLFSFVPAFSHVSVWIYSLPKIFLQAKAGWGLDGVGVWAGKSPLLFHIYKR